MPGHPIEKLMNTAMENIQQMVDVNTIVGDAVETQDGTVIIPISRVNFGFGAGGADYSPEKKESPEKNDKQKKEQQEKNYGFGGGSGAGVMLNPMAFLVVNQENVRLLPVSDNVGLDRLLNMAPELIKELKGVNEENRAEGTPERNFS